MKKLSVLLIVTTGILSLTLIGLMIFRIFVKGWEDSNIPVIESEKTSSETPRLFTEGNKLKRRDTEETVVLKGATSDAFRKKEGKYKDFAELLRRLTLLNQAGGNLITFWVTNDGYNKRTDLAKKVVDFADEKGMYVLWAPVEPYAADWDIKRTELMVKIVDEFKDKNNVIFGLDAEPFQKWEVVVFKATRLGNQIRNIAPDALLFLPGGNGGKEIYQDGNTVFPLNNTLFGTEQYLARDLSSLKKILNEPDYKEQYIWQNPSYKDIPILITEMGGVVSFDFGSPEDLEVIGKMLADIEKRRFNYQMHSIDTYNPSVVDGKTYYDTVELGMFDEKGGLTKKGKLYMNFLADHPATKIK